MNMSKKIYALSLMLCFLVSTVGTYIAMNGMLVPHHQLGSKTNVELYIEDNYGVHSIASGNVITNIGENYVRDILGFQNVSAPENATKWISLSNDASPVQTWTKLPNEETASGSTRALGSVSAWVSSSDYAYNVTNKFTFTGDITLQCVGLQWSGVASSDNNLFACAAFTQTAFANTWNLTITWSIVVDAN